MRDPDQTEMTPVEQQQAQAAAEQAEAQKAMFMAELEGKQAETALKLANIQREHGMTIKDRGRDRGCDDLCAVRHHNADHRQGGGRHSSGSRMARLQGFACDAWASANAGTDAARATNARRAHAGGASPATRATHGAAAHGAAAAVSGPIINQLERKDERQRRNH